MRGQVQKQTEAFYYIMIEDRVPQKHPLRKVKTIANTLIAELDPLFDSIYSSEGRSSIAPEYLLRASILQILYTIRSERNLMEHIDFNILFRWFVGLGLDAPVWDHSTFTKNRERFLESEVAHQFFGKVVEHARQKGLLSDDHFTVDGTLLEAWASMKSFQPKTPSDSGTDAGSAGKNPDVDFHGEKRANATHASRTDPDARLYKKSAGSASKLCYMGHVLMENRNGLVVKNTLTHANGTAEREAALSMLGELGTSRHRTLGGDKGYDADTFVQALRDRNIRSLPLPPSFRSSGHRASAALPRPSLTRNSPPEEGGGIRARYCRALLFRSRDSSQVSISRHRGLSGSTQFNSKQGRAPSLLSFRHIRTLAEEGSAGRE